MRMGGNVKHRVFIWHVVVEGRVYGHWDGPLCLVLLVGHGARRGQQKNTGFQRTGCYGRTSTPPSTSGRHYLFSRFL